MVKLVSITDKAEEIITYIARVSNPSNQNNKETMPKLLKYLIKNKHWSPFEHAHMTLEIKTSRAIAPQILRHRSFTFQEFSMRYAKINGMAFVPSEARSQDLKNRQNSNDDMSEETKQWFRDAQWGVNGYCYSLYEKALEKGIAKECARVLLPLSTETTLYMSGSIRSWIHYVELRSSNGTQKEHMDIALACKESIKSFLPNVAEALEWL